MYHQNIDKFLMVASEAPDSAAALRLAGLDWNVIQKDIMTVDGGDAIPGFKANVRDTDGSVLGIVTDRYKVVQNAEAFSFTDALLGEGVRYETTGSLQDGRRTWWKRSHKGSNFSCAGGVPEHAEPGAFHGKAEPERKPYRPHARNGYSAQVYGNCRGGYVRCSECDGYYHPENTRILIRAASRSGHVCDDCERGYIACPYCNQLVEVCEDGTCPSCGEDIEESVPLMKAEKGGEIIRKGEYQPINIGVKDVVFREILLPSKAPPKFHDRQELVDAINDSENRKDSQLARTIKIALPNELPFDRQLALA